MEKAFVKYLLIAMFMIGYLYILNLLWTYLPIYTSLAVLVGSLFVIVISLLLSLLTMNKVIEAIRE